MIDVYGIFILAFHSSLHSSLHSSFFLPLFIVILSRLSLGYAVRYLSYLRCVLCVVYKYMEKTYTGH